MVEYKNLKHYPLGEAILEVIEGKLIISNLTDSGIDGVAINTEDNPEWLLKFKGFEVGADNSVNILHFGEDGHKRLKVLGQQSMYYDKKTNKVTFAFNSKLLSDNVLLVAKKDGKTVFQGKYLTPRDNSCINWWPIAVAVGLYILDKVDYKYTTTTDSEGNTTTTQEYSWNSKSTSIQTIDGIKFEADELLFYSTLHYSKGCKDNVNKIKEIQITARNYKKIEIEDEKYC